MGPCPGLGGHRDRRFLELDGSRRRCGDRSMNRRLDVVIVHYHTPSLLVECVNAVRADFAVSGLEGDIIVVDNGSNTNDLERWAGLPIRLVKPSGNPGYAAGLHRGVEESTADYLTLMNAGETSDAVDPLALAALARFRRLRNLLPQRRPARDST